MLIYSSIRQPICEHLGAVHGAEAHSTTFKADKDTTPESTIAWKTLPGATIVDLTQILRCIGDRVRTQQDAHKTELPHGLCH